MKEVQVEVQRDHLERISTGRPILAVAELIWNALDADAQHVDVAVDENRLGGMERIRVSDDGTGIPHSIAVEYFKKLGGSWKKETRRTPSGRYLHGKEGQGRFQAFALGGRVEWDTTVNQGKKRVRFKVTADSGNLGKFRIADPTTAHGGCGTEVSITNLRKDFTSLRREKATQELTEEFALYLRQYPKVVISYGGTRIDPASIEIASKAFDLSPVTLSSGDVVRPQLFVIEWGVPADRALFVCDGAGFALTRLAPGIQAPGFNFTAYLKSDHFDELATKNAIEGLEELDPDLRKILDAAKAQLRDYFRKRAAESATALVETWKKEDLYPYKDPPKGVLEETERQVFDVLALNVNEFLPDFGSADPRNKRFSFRLLRQALEESPAALQRIFADVLGLPKEKQEELAKLLERTTLAAIINASKLISNRLDLLTGLEMLVFEQKDALKERSQLHRILESNTWVFGEEYNLSVDDQSLTEVLNKHVALLGRAPTKGPEVLTTDGTRAIVDLMLSRLIPQPRANEREHLVIELKRPKQPVNADVSTQIQKYAFAVAEDERFKDTHTRWTFWAISNELDPHVRRLTRQKDRAEGILHQDEELRLTVWAKTWAQVFAECRGRLEFFRKSLAIEADRDKSLEYLRKTHARYLPMVPEDSESQSARGAKTAPASRPKHRRTR